MVRGIKRNHIQYYRVHVLAERSKALTVRITKYHDNSLINYSPPESIVYRETVLRTTCNRCNHKRNQKLDENERMSLQLINDTICLPLARRIDLHTSQITKEHENKHLPWQIHLPCKFYGADKLNYFLINSVFFFYV